MVTRPQLGLEYAEILARVDLFAGLDRVTLAKLAAHLEPMPVDSGAAVVRQGEAGDAFYLVVRGTFGIYVAGAGHLGETRINTLGPGAPFGEMALLAADRGRRPCAPTAAPKSSGSIGRASSGWWAASPRWPSRSRARCASVYGRPTHGSWRARAGCVGGIARCHEPGGRRPGVRDGPREDGAPAAAGIGALLAVAILAVTWLTPPPPGLTPAGWRALGTLVAAAPVLALDALPEGVLALALAAVWVLGGIAPVNVALGGFASTSWVLLVSVLVVGASIASSGLLYRLALWIVAHTRGGFAGQVLRPRPRRRPDRSGRPATRPDA